MDEQTQIVYVALLNEGTDVWRPVEARQIEKGYYELLVKADYNPADEEWQFRPNTIVECKQRADGTLIAVAKAPQKSEK